MSLIGEFGNNTYPMYLHPEYRALHAALVRVGTPRAVELARYLDANSATLARVCSGAWQPSPWHRPTSLPSGMCSNPAGVGSYLSEEMHAEAQQIVESAGESVGGLYTGTYLERASTVKTGTTARTASGRVEVQRKALPSSSERTASNVIELAPRLLNVSDFDPTNPETIDDPPLFDTDDPTDQTPSDFDDICEACLLDPEITCPDYCQHGAQQDTEGSLPWGWIIVGVGILGTAGYLISRR